MAAWLFYVDVLARLHAGYGHGRVPVVGSGDGDGVHVLRLQDVSEVLFCRGSVAQRGLGLVGELLQDGAVYIADMRDAGGSLVGLERVEVSVGAGVEADD